MTPALQTTPNREETFSGLYRHYGLYAPLVWMVDSVVVLVLGLGMRAGFISKDFLRPPAPAPRPSLLTNRRYRRGKQAAMARLKRHMRRHRQCGGRGLNPDDYMPRALKHIYYIKMMPKHWSVHQFKEHLVRDTDYSRVQIYGLDHAHAIMSVVPEVVSHMLSVVFAGIAKASGSSSLNFAAPADPAPP